MRDSSGYLVYIFWICMALCGSGVRANSPACKGHAQHKNTGWQNFQKEDKFCTFIGNERNDIN